MNPPDTKAPQAATAHSPKLVGRERELALFRRGLDEVADGAGDLFVVVGEAGLGKSRLCEEFTREAVDRGLAVLHGRCWEAVDAPAYWPWIQVLRQFTEGMPEDELRIAARSIPDELRRLVPALSERMDGDEQDPAGEISRFELFDAIASLLVRAASSRPFGIVLEDLHAADESSLLLLEFLVNNYRRSALLVTTFDPTQLHARPGHDRVLSAIASQGHKITLDRLDRDAVRTLYVDLAGDEPSDEILTALYEATEGNPLFILESIRMLTTRQELHRPDYSRGFRVPEGARALLRQRLDALRPETIEILGVASVLGREFELSTLESVSEIDRDRLLELLDDALRASVILEASSLGRFQFAHILMRETLYEDLTSGKRMRLHLRAAETFEEAGAADSERYLPQLAHHYFKSAQAADPTKTLEYVVKAARSAEAKDAYEEAARLYHRALMVAEQARKEKAEVTRLRAAVAAMQARSKESITPAEPLTARFALGGDVWSITFESRSTQLKDSKGLRYIAQLVANPGVEVHVLELVRLVQGTAGIPARAVESEDLAMEGGGAGAVLDSTAKAQYKRRLQELEEDIREADDFNDPERATAARREYEALVQQLAEGIGLGGRDRSAASASERARVSVTKAIKEALKKMKGHDPRLEGHLRSAIQTGTFCSYRPDPRAGISWEVVTP